MAIYMKYGSIKGAVTTEGFKDWIELDSCKWAVGRRIGSAARGSTNREGSEPSISEIAITKKYDVSSPKLMMEAMAGQLNSAVTIKFTTTTKDQVTDYLTYQLSNCGISGYGVGGDPPAESMSLNFTMVMVTHKGLDPAESGNPQTVGYDLTKMKKV